MAEKVAEDIEKKKEPLYYCKVLERGDILFLLKAPFSIDDEKFFSENLEEYSRKIVQFLSSVLTPYVNEWKCVDSKFHSNQMEMGRIGLDSQHPVHGMRVLRFFMNMSRSESAHWTTSKNFLDLVREIGGKVLVPKSAAYRLKDRMVRKMKRMLNSSIFHIPLRSPYDRFILNVDRFLKKSKEFQSDLGREWEFPPGSCWAVFSDLLSHSHVKGKNVLELTFSIPLKILLYPENSPVCVLERMWNRNLVDHEFLRDFT